MLEQQKSAKIKNKESFSEQPASEPPFFTKGSFESTTIPSAQTKESYFESSRLRSAKFHGNGAAAFEDSKAYNQDFQRSYTEHLQHGSYSVPHQGCLSNMFQPCPMGQRSYSYYSNHVYPFVATIMVPHMYYGGPLHQPHQWVPKKPQYNTERGDIHHNGFFQKPLSIFEEYGTRSLKPDYANARTPYLSCDLCMRKFKKLSSLKLHIFSHIEYADVFTCPISGCGIGLKDTGAATRHLTEFHQISKPNTEMVLSDQKWSYHFKSYLALCDFYKLSNQEENNVFKDAFCFGCFTFPISLEMHPCNGRYTNLLVCPACNLNIEWQSLKNHSLSDECIRKVSRIKAIP